MPFFQETLLHSKVFLALQYCYGEEKSIAMLNGLNSQPGNQIKWATNMTVSDTETSNSDSE